jgi:hypothetical protein
VNVEQITPVEVDSEEVEEEIDPEIDEIEDNTVAARTPAGRLSGELNGPMEFNRDPVGTEETAEVAMLNQAFSGKAFYGGKALISAFDNGADKPKNFKEASKHKNRKEWWDANMFTWVTSEQKVMMWHDINGIQDSLVGIGCMIPFFWVALQRKLPHDASIILIKWIIVEIQVLFLIGTVMGSNGR